MADDLFAIGSLFFEILTGKRLYNDVNSLVVERCYEDRVFPVLDGINLEYATIIENCWNERYYFIQDIENDLPPLSC